jgi:hypothetical protein
MKLPNLRQRRADRIAHELLAEIRHLNLEDRDWRLVRETLQDVLERNGAHIMTDADRAEMGLEPRDNEGWTPSERVKLEIEHRDAMMTMASIMVPRDVL